MTFCVDQSPFSSTHHRCRNTRDLVHSGKVPVEFCERCPYRRESIGDFWEETARLSARQRKTQTPKPCSPCNKQTATSRQSLSVNGPWSVVVTTAPRSSPTVQRCVDSIRRAGWEPVLFAEPNSQQIAAETITHDVCRGVWHNWLASCRYALATDAEYILTVQDDTILHPDSRSFIESIMWPSDRVGFVSLYTPAHYSRLMTIGVHEIKTRSLWGACALVWPRESLQAIVDHPKARNWLGAKCSTQDATEAQYEANRQQPSLIKHNDTAIGIIMHLMQREMWFIDPSPAYHAATESTIGHGSNRGNRNCLRCADHSKPLREQVFPTH